MGLLDNLRKALAEGGGQHDGRSQQPAQQQQIHPFDSILAAQHPDTPFNRMLAIKGTFDGGGQRVMHLGATHADWMVTARNGHALALAPPQAPAGKTSSFIIPVILSTHGNLVATSTKSDIVRATALARAEYGTVWCYAPDGQTPIPPGVRELRWSPISGAADWGVALRTAYDMVRMLKDDSTVSGGSHWRDRARDALAPVFHWTALRGYTMRHARDAVLQLATMVDNPAWPGKRTMLGQIIIHELQKDRRANTAAAPTLQSVMSTGDRELASIISTAARSLQVYQIPEAIALTENPNFDSAGFVEGWYGRSTVYIMSSNESQEMVAPLVIAFLNQIRQAQYRQQRQFAHEQMSRRQAQDDPNAEFPINAFMQDVHEQQAASSTTVFALDEMYGIAPIPDIANMLSEGGSQGVLVAAAVQDLALVKDRWKVAGDSFLTLFGDVLVFPGIRHGDTLEAVSKLIGEEDVPIPGTTEGTSGGQQTYTESMSYQRRRRMPPDAVSRGPDPTNPDLLLHLSGQGVGTLWATPYWRSPPWPQVLTSCMYYALNGNGESTWAEGARMLGRTDVHEPKLTELPCPDLTWWAERNRGRDPWADVYLDARRQWEARLLPPGRPEHGEAEQDEEHEREPEHERHGAPPRRGHERREAEQQADDGHPDAAAAPHHLGIGSGPAARKRWRRPRWHRHDRRLTPRLLWRCAAPQHDGRLAAR